MIDYSEFLEQIDISKLSTKSSEFKKLLEKDFSNSDVISWENCKDGCVGG